MVPSCSVRTVNHDICNDKNDGTLQSEFTLLGQKRSNQNTDRKDLRQALVSVTSEKSGNCESDLFSKNFMLHDTVFIVFLTIHDHLIVDIVGCFIQVEQGSAHRNFELLAYVCIS